MVPLATCHTCKLSWRSQRGFEMHVDAIATTNRVISEEEESVQSDGASTMVEGKVLSTEANLPQAVGTCVVSPCLLTRSSFVSACMIVKKIYY